MLRNSPEYKVRYRTDKIPHSICRAAPHGLCSGYVRDPGLFPDPALVGDLLVSPASALRCSLAFWGCDGRLACKGFYYFRRSRSELDADSARCSGYVRDPGLFPDPAL